MSSPLHSLRARVLTWPALLALAAGLAGGALCGEAVWWALLGAQAERAPAGWTLEPSRVPYQLTDLAGDLPHRADAWSLAHWRGLEPVDHGGPRSLGVGYQLAEGGQLEIALSPDRSPDGATIILERVGSPSVSVVTRQGGRQQAASCSTPLLPPGAEPAVIEIREDGPGLRIRQGEQDTLCRTGQGMPWQPRVRPGLQRIHITELQRGESVATPSGPPPRPLPWLLGAVAGFALVAVQLIAGARASIVLLTSLPLLLAGLFAGRDPALWAESARVTWLPVRWLPALGPAAMTAVLAGSHALGRALRGVPWDAGSARLRGGVAIVLWMVTASVAIAALGGASGPGVGLAAVLAGAWALLVWANANARRLRFYNTTCLLLAIALAGGAEAWLRTTPADDAWDAARPMPGASNLMDSTAMAERDFGDIQQRQHTDYPDSGYPVAITPADGRPRLVVMGGSTTGGAWQNDDLNEFYPARLDAYLGGTHQVLNQGVGGWTTWHIRHYLDQGAFELLEPDLLVLYVGHNDLLTPAPLPYAQLYERWADSGALTASSGMLNRSRLYQGMRYLLMSMGPASLRVAVPEDHAQDNLGWMIERVVARGGTVILVSEGLAPDPAPMTAYNTMLSDLAEASPSVRYIDAASVLHEQSGSRVFLDDCHLTPIGHDLLARLLLSELEDAGLLLAPPAELPPPVDAALPPPGASGPAGGPQGPQGAPM